jgi:D-psicose/D-tagatose/L-ribulose 3-epimerase
VRLGIYTESANADIVKRVGYDFIELSVAELVPEQPEGEFAPVRERIAASGLKAEALNRLIPKGIMLVGPDPDLARARRYVEVALTRAAQIGTEIIVWGSGWARHIPEGFPRERAMDQLAEFGRLLGQVAAQHGQTIVVEPLDPASTNTIWTVQEGYDLARRIEHGSVKTMADIYHMANNNEPLQVMTVAGDFLAHIHVCDPDRLPPNNPAHFGSYRETFQILRGMGYRGRVCIEANMEDFEAEAKRGLEVLKQALA